MSSEKILQKISLLEELVRASKEDSCGRLSGNPVVEHKGLYFTALEALLGFYHFEAGDVHKAIGYFNKSKRKDLSSSYHIYSSLGLHFNREPTREKALECLNEDEKEALRKRIKTASHRDKKEKIEIEALEDSIRHLVGKEFHDWVYNPEKKEFNWHDNPEKQRELWREKYAKLGIFLFLGDYSYSLGDFKKAEQLFGDSTIIHHADHEKKLAFCQYIFGDPESAVKTLEDFTRLDLARRSKNQQSMFIDKRKALSSQLPEDPRCFGGRDEDSNWWGLTDQNLALLGCYYYLTGNPKKARLFVAEARRQNNNLIYSLETLEKIAEQLGSPGLFIGDFERIARRDEDPDYYAHCLLASYAERSLIKGKTKSDYYKIMISQLLRKGSLEQEMHELGIKSRNKIRYMGHRLSDFNFDDSTLDQVLIIKSGPEPFDKEKQIRYKLEEIVRKSAVKEDNIDKMDKVVYGLAKMELWLIEKAYNFVRGKWGFDDLTQKVIGKFSSDIKKNRERSICRKQKVILPEYVDHFEFNGSYYYLMRRANGYNLSHYFRVGYGSSYIPEVVRSLSNIHVLFPTEILSFSHDREYMKKKLENGVNDIANRHTSSQKNMDSGEINAFVEENCAPMLDVLLSSRNMCYNKDSIAVNWLVESRIESYRIVMLDTEDRGVVPYALDLAAFLNFPPPKCLMRQDVMKQEEIVRQYIQMVNRVCKEEGLPERAISDESLFMKEYYNAVIYRTIMGRPYLKNLEEIKDRDYAEDWLPLDESGLLAIDYLRKHGMISPADEHKYSTVRSMLVEDIEGYVKDFSVNPGLIFFVEEGTTEKLKKEVKRIKSLKWLFDKIGETQLSSYITSREEEWKGKLRELSKREGVFAGLSRV